MRWAVRLALGAAAALGLVREASADPINFTFAYPDIAPGNGFQDAVLGPERRAALKDAGAIWGRTLIAAFPGETIQTTAVLGPGFGIVPNNAAGATTVDDTELIHATSNTGAAIYNGPAGVPAALANHLRQADLLPPGSPFSASGSEIRIVFGADIHYSYNLGQPPSGTRIFGDDFTDFVSVALHEIGHGLGFLTRVGETGSFSGDLPEIYDAFTETASGTPLVGLAPADRLAAVTMARNIVFAGPNASAAAGQPPILRTVDGQYFPGFSLLHLDGAAFGFPNLLMNTAFESDTREAVRSIDPITLGVLQDEGWTIAAAATSVAEPSSYYSLVTALVLAGFLSRRRGQQPGAESG